MLKKYPVDKLKEGMVLGRTVYAEDMSILLGEGTVLDEQRIEYLDQRGIVFVRILLPDADEADKAAEPPAAAKPPQAKKEPEAASKVSSEQTQAAMAVLAAAEEAKKKALAEVEARAAQRAAKAKKEAQSEVPEEVHREEMPLAPEEEDHRPTSKSGVVLRKTSVLEAAYLEKYEACFEELQNFFSSVRANGRIDVAEADTISRNFAPLSSSAKAVTHIYNMETIGSYQLHHTMRVAVLAGLMAQWLKMPAQERQRLILAAFLMDIGYTSFAPNFLKKIALYTPEERRLMEKHARLGYEIVSHSALQLDKQVVEAVLQHHERNDGSGYPQKMKKDGICKFARILAILDTYDAMASRRYYAKRRSPFEVFSVLSDECIAGRLDAEYGIVFIHNFSSTLNGNWVKLSNGEVAKIVYIDGSRMNALPVVQTLDGKFLDLNTMLSIRVEYLLSSSEVEKNEEAAKEAAANAT